jgi:hypothetical protein
VELVIVTELKEALIPPPVVPAEFPMMTLLLTVSSFP